MKDQEQLSSIEFRKKAQKNQKIIEISLSIFLSIAILIIYFDLGAIESIEIFSTAVSAIVPSIYKTAMYTPAPKSSALVLALAWSLMPIALYWMFRVGDWRKIANEGIEKGWILKIFNLAKIFLMIFSAMIMLITLFFFTPDPNDSVRIGKRIYKFLSGNRYFIAVYGTILWLCGTVLIWGLAYFIKRAHILLLGKCHSKFSI